MRDLFYPCYQGYEGVLLHSCDSVSQISESLDSIFESENRVLDTTVTIHKDIDGFPYHLIHDWVRPHTPLCHLVSLPNPKPTSAWIGSGFMLSSTTV